ncbi:MAG: VOC family protein [Lachnospiraceae bacterium]|nr:VOC family protein [Lachnospiraceae bacterium]MDD3660541.1 VOC family protein [Lachnospiraceae bacterium]
MSVLIPYLNFEGNCNEAMNFYKECFGGELVVQTVAESPMADQMPLEMKDLVLHARLEKGNIIIMASDAMDKEMVNGSMITLMIQCDSEEEINSYFANLSAGGVVSMPLSKQFWGATYGQLTDKFGVLWSLNYENSQG